MKITVICGICGKECSLMFKSSTELEATRHYCQDVLKSDAKTIGYLEDEIFELQRKGSA